MRRLYIQIYITLVGILVLFGLLVGLAWLTFTPEDSHGLQALEVVADELLPGARSSPEELRSAVESLHQKLDTSLAVSTSDGRLLAAAGEPLPLPPPDWVSSRWIPSRGAGFTLSLRLSGDRWLTVRHRRERRFAPALVGLVGLAAAIAVGAFPLVRRLTRRLERLQRHVDALGAGELDARLSVEGNDEVAELAKSFNRAASRIEELVGSQRRLLAATSHELRSPLTRLRMALELIGSEIRPELKERIERDIDELDELIEEILLASRLEASTGPPRSEIVDLLALAVEEAAHYDAVDVSGESVAIEGDRALLRRMVRNLFENAVRHGGGDVSVEVASRSPEGVRLRVLDRGRGIPAPEAARVFEPFYRGQTEPSDDGSRGVGLGLALVRSIARQHRGDVRFGPREGGGSVFEVVLTGVGTKAPKETGGDSSDEESPP